MWSRLGAAWRTRGAQCAAQACISSPPAPSFAAASRMVPPLHRTPGAASSPARAMSTLVPPGRSLGEVTHVALLEAEEPVGTDR